MKKLLPIILFLTSIPLTAQTDSTSRFSYGIAASADYCYRTLTSEPATEWIMDSRNAYEIPKIGFTAGLQARYMMNKRFSLDAGLLFADRGERSKDYVLLYSQPDPAFPTKARFNYHYYYLDVPVTASYFFTIGNKSRIYLSAGIAPNIFLAYNNAATLTYADERTEKENNKITGNSIFNPVTVSFVGGVGFSTSFGKHLGLNIQPVYRRSFMSIVKDTSIDQFLYSGGLEVSLLYSR